MTKRNTLSLIAVIAIGVGIFWYLIRDVNIKLLQREFFHINWWWIIIAIACVTLYYLLESAVIKILMRNQTAHFSWKDALRIPVIEHFFNGITPFSTGGQPAELMTMLQTGVDGGKASSVLLMKFVVFQSMIVINFIISLLIGFHYLMDKMSYLAWFVAFGFLIHLLVIIGLLLIMFWHNFTEHALLLLLKPLKYFVSSKRYAKWMAILHEKILNFYHESLSIIHQGRMILKVMAMTFLQLFFYYLIPYFIMLGLGYSGKNIVMIVSLNILIFMIISLFPIPGGSGGAEYSFGILFRGFLRSPSRLILAMLLWRLLTYYLGLFLGLIALFIKPDRIKI